MAAQTSKVKGPRPSVRAGSKGGKRKAVSAKLPVADGLADTSSVPTVGIGASAGGLEAFTKFFNAMPADSGMAFVLIQHLDPTHESLTADLLARHTDMTVVQVENQMAVEANHVYSIPPNKYLTISDNTLYLTDPVRRRGMRMPIDHFFRSLGEDQQKKAIGVVLCGTGSDGTLGLRALKGSGGMAMAQAPETARFDSMPRNAIAMGQVDYICPIEEMPGILIQYIQHAYIKDANNSEALTTQVSDQLSSILAVLHTRTRFDFRCYKKGTLLRRIGRRMGVKHIERVADYLTLLRDDPIESTQLVKDFLIRVTRFFRDPQAFKALEKPIIEQLIQGKVQGVPIRVWVPACASGEEAYSVAMLCIEQLQAAERNNPIQIFATDIDDGALDLARGANYPENIVADVSPTRLQRFFIKRDQHYELKKEVRDCVVFAKQNLIGDPPFSKLDLICCRNLLIYLEPLVQSQVIKLFHFALNEGGILFLGNSETIGQHGDLFKPVSKKWRVYRRQVAIRPVAVNFPIASGRHGPGKDEGAARPRLSDAARLGQLAERRLLHDYAPASVLVNQKGQILYFYGPTDQYLKQPTGAPTDDLVAMARQGLRGKLRSVVHRAIRDGQRATTTGAHLRRDGTNESVTVVVNPIEMPELSEKLLLVSFEDSPSGLPPQTQSDDEPKPAGESLMHQMEHELRTSKDEMQGAIEELESSNEELKVANEETMSMNEELQSTNEELETSQEELQSLNEELTTVNNQLQEKMTELEAAHNDLSNLFTSTDIATLFLDTQFRIKRFTPATTKLLNLIGTDVGRSISDISPRYQGADLRAAAEVVMDKLNVLEQEVCTSDNHWYIQRVLPYRTQHNKIDGVVATFVDITTNKRAVQSEQDARNFAESILATVREPFLVLDQELRVVSANASFYRTFKVKPEQTENRQLYELGDREWDIPTLRRMLKEIGSSKGSITDFEVTHDFPTVGLRSMLLNANRVEQREDRPQLLLLAIEDITEHKAAEAALFAAKEHAQVTLQSIGDAVISTDRDSVIEYMNPTAETMTGWTLDEARDQPLSVVLSLVDGKSHTPVPDPVARCLKAGQTIGLADPTLLISRNDQEYAIQSSVAPLRDRMGHALGAVLILSDVTVAHRMTEKMRHQASHDVLTGLVNRREFERRLQRVLATALTEQSEHALCYLDLDQFKIINDTCGHVAGDELLRQLGELLQKQPRKRDTVARLGGDEFGVLLERCSIHHAQRVANDLRRCIENYRFVWENKSFNIGASIGLVPITNASESIDAIMNAADAACYAAKDRGRNRVHVYRENDAALAKRHGEMQWVSRIQNAMDENRIHLGRQPIIPVHSGDDAGEHYELLLWMEDEGGRKVPPGAFLPAAERYNLSTKIDCWVIENALKWLTRHPKRLKQLHLCCINLSGNSLGDEEFLAFALDKLQQTPVPLENICFEITETAAIANLASATRFINALKKLGCQFALDDFGSGLSSFAYLKNLPVDFLKIDGMFVKDIINDPIDLAMVKSINEIGHVMGKKTIAEWVESEAVLSKVRELGIDYAQGHCIGRSKTIV